MKAQEISTFPIIFDRIGSILRQLFHVELNQIEIKRLETYLSIVLRENQRLNLTGYKNPEDFSSLGILDSLYGYRAIKESKCSYIVDLGSGSGLPGIPLGILFSEKVFFLVESRKKRADFLRMAIETLDLPNIHVLSGRYESINLRSKGCGEYILVSKAVASIKKTLDLIALSPTPPKEALFWKGINYLGEIKEAEKVGFSWFLQRPWKSFPYQLPSLQNQGGDVREHFLVKF